MMEETFWGYYNGIDIGYWIHELEGDEDCLILTMGSSGNQIDTDFIKRDSLVKENHFPPPFGCWRIKGKNYGKRKM